MIDEDTGEAFADGFVEQDSGNTGIDTARQAEDDTILA